MPLDPLDDRRPPISPQLAVRVAGFGVVAFVLFGIVFFRLWYLQVLDGDRYVAQARDNQVRTERIQAPRGSIVDVKGIELVRNRRATVVALDPQSVSATVVSKINAWGQAVNVRDARPKGRRGPKVPMPEPDAGLERLERRLGRVLDDDPAIIHQRIVAGLVRLPYADVRLKTDVDVAQRNYLVEHAERFPGVKVDTVYLREYPYKSLAAQLLGTIGQINPDQLKERRNRAIAKGSVIGQSGLEYSYDRYLRGTDGAYSISVNAFGERQRAVTSREPRPGRQIKLTLDLSLQQAGERALRDLGGGRDGAFVAMNPEDGSVYGMGSLPTYDLNALSPSPTQEQYERLTSGGSAAFNRAVSGQYAVGSTFKPTTALAGLATGKITPQYVFTDTGCLQVGKREEDERCNDKSTPHGRVDLARALTVSSDTYFYRLGLELNPLGGQPLQDWARKLGFGRNSGIDLPEGAAGVVPDAAWRRRQNAKEAACRKRQGSPCGYADGENRGWQDGDEVNLSIGQGDLQASPLQLALAYSTIVNGGTRVTPHLGLQVQDADGELLQRLEPPRGHKVAIDPTWRQAIMDGLKGAVSGAGGTSTDVFKDWPHDRFPVFAKTGTVQRAGKPNSSVFVAYAYDAQRPKANPIVISCIIEGGGYGAATAAPAVGRMLAKWFNVRTEFFRGTSTDR